MTLPLLLLLLLMMMMRATVLPGQRSSIMNQRFGYTGPEIRYLFMRFNSKAVQLALYRPRSLVTVGGHDC